LTGIPQATTIGVTGDGIPDFRYDPLTGDVVFLKDNVSANGISRISALQLQSAAGLFNTNNSTFNGPTDVLTPTSLSGANFATAGYPDNMDLGRILPVGLLINQLTADLTVKYQIFG